jgi:hypothetical protein
MPKEITPLGDKQFVALFKAERGLEFFLTDSEEAGTAVDAGFLEHLRGLRNRAVDAMLLMHFREKDPMCAKLPSKARNMVSQFELPDLVEIPFPAMTFKGASVPAQSITVRVDLCTNSCVRVELSETALACVRIAALIYMDSANGRQKKRAKRLGSDRCKTGYDYISPDYRRNQLFVKYTNKDGIQKRRSASCDAMDDQSNVDDAVAELWEFLKHNHYSLRDGAFRLASRHGLEMFEGYEVEVDESERDVVEGVEDAESEPDGVEDAESFEL